MKAPFFWLGGLIIAGYVVSTSVVQVAEAELVLVTQLGNPVRVIDRAGLHFKWPDPVQTAVRLDRRMQVLDAEASEYLTLDKKNIVVGAFMLWRIVDAGKYLQSVRDRNGAERRLIDLASSELGVAIGHQPLNAFLNAGPEGSRLPAIMAGVTEACRTPARQEFGIEIVDIRLRRLGFPNQNLLAVYDRMRAEREAIAKQYRAEGEEAAANIRSRTDLEVRELLASAYREAQIAQGKGEAESIAIYARAFQKDPEFYKLSRTLEAYQKLMDERTTLILSSRSPLFKYLEAPPK